MLWISGFASQKSLTLRFNFHPFAKAAAKVLKLLTLSDISAIVSVERPLSACGFYDYFQKCHPCDAYLWAKITSTMSRHFPCLLFLLMFASQVHSQPLFSPFDIATIEITFSQSNWDAILDNYYAAGNGERLLAQVEINGVTFDSVGVRYRGGGTYDPSNAKNPLNIKLDHVKSQDYEGVEVLKLSNGAKDPSFLREVLSLEAARMFMEAPRANYARVFVNGSYLGLYADVESINAAFFENNFQLNPDAPRFECNPLYDFDEAPQSPPFGCTAGHGSSLEYLGPGISCYFDHYQLQSPTGWEALASATEKLKNNPSSADQYFDIDRMLWWSVFNSLFVNLNSYLGAGSRNYFLGTTNDGHFVPVPDDLNESFAKYPWVDVDAAAGAQPPFSFFAELSPFQGGDDSQKPLLQALFGQPTWKRMYLAHYRTAVNDLLLSGWLEERAAELQDLISDELLADANSIYSFQDFKANLTGTVVDTYDGYDAYGILPTMNSRVAYLQSLDEWQYKAPELSDPAHSPNVPNPGENVTFNVKLDEPASAWLGWRSNATEVFKYLPMFDDGLHGDGTAGDLLYGVVLPVSAGGGQYYFYAENNLAGAFLPAKAAHEYFVISAAANIVINELMADNQSTVSDQDGEFDDWIELHNNSTQTIDLGGWHLTDDPVLPAKWTFPNGTFIDPGTYLIVWADNDTDQGGLHASFKLASGGEQLQLLNPNMQVVDEVVYPQLLPDVSFARCPDGTGPFVASGPSFDSSNNPVCATASEEQQPELVAYYPNPASELVSILPGSQQTGQLVITDILGREVIQERMDGAQQLDVSGWQPGVYLMLLDGSPVGRLIVQH